MAALKGKKPFTIDRNSPNQYVYTCSNSNSRRAIKDSFYMFDYNFICSLGEINCNSKDSVFKKPSM